jgi:hypothetical protein
LHGQIPEAAPRRLRDIQMKRQLVTRTNRVVSSEHADDTAPDGSTTGRDMLAWSFDELDL